MISDSYRQFVNGLGRKNGLGPLPIPGREEPAARDALDTEPPQSTDAVVELIVRAGRLRRGEESPGRPPIGSGAAQIIAAGRRARGEDDD
jgi:hypothetical protein